MPVFVFVSILAVVRPRSWVPRAGEKIYTTRYRHLIVNLWVIIINGRLANGITQYTVLDVTVDVSLNPDPKRVILNWLILLVGGGFSRVFFQGTSEPGDLLEDLAGQFPVHDAPRCSRCNQSLSPFLQASFHSGRTTEIFARPYPSSSLRNCIHQ